MVAPRAGRLFGVAVVLVGALAVCSGRRGGGACKDATDCNLNGDCTGGACVCDPGWAGSPSCGVLRLLPNPSESQGIGNYIAPHHTSSWGMSVVSGENGTYHGFVSEFANGCKLDSWTTNSYVNHVVASSPMGPWRQAASGKALGVWAHNPKVAHAAKDGHWVMFHIGAANDPARAKNCTGALGPRPAAPRHMGKDIPVAAANGVFSIHSAPSLDGPWAPLAAGRRGSGTGPAGSLLTLYPGVSNIDTPAAPAGGVRLYEAAAFGNGTVTVPFASFSPGPGGALAWDACGGPPLAFDNGHPVEEPNVGSRVGAFEVAAPGVRVLAGSPCALLYPPPHGPITYGPFDAGSGRTTVPNETNYFELVGTAQPGVAVLGRTMNATECRRACEGRPDCVSFTWEARRAPPGTCFGRTDTLWFPNETSGDPALLASGRPWTFDGDNPAPYVDAATGQWSVLYRCDSPTGAAPGGMASLIGVATAASWRGPYSMAGGFGGPISRQDYPFDENEDPFQWRSRRGWHALFHANTWADSHGKHFPVASHAGRYAYSVDGRVWHYSPEPAYNGTVRYANGSSLVFSRMERPVLLHNEAGHPTHLFNGVQRYPDPYTFTLIQRVALE